MKEPSEKQVKVVRFISVTLQIPPPTEYSAQAYWQFTNLNLDNANRVKAAQQSVSYRPSRPTNRSSRSLRDRIATQRENDRAARRLSEGAYAMAVLDGKYGAPSWSGCSDQEFRDHLRSLGYLSTAEEKAETERGLAWGGLEGPPECW